MVVCDCGRDGLLWQGGMGQSDRQLELWDVAAMTRHNVFFALGLPVAASERVTRLMRGIIERRCLGARLLPPERLHVSLIGIGDVTGPLPVSLIEVVEACAGSLRIDPFEVTFTSVAHFGGDAIVLRTRDDAALVVFREALMQTLWKAGVRLPDKSARNSFTPHVTMAYGSRIPEFPVEPLSWIVDEFVLIDSWVGQSKHATLGRWPLSA